MEKGVIKFLTFITPGGVGGGSSKNLVSRKGGGGSPGVPYYLARYLNAPLNAEFGLNTKLCLGQYLWAFVERKKSKL